MAKMIVFAVIIFFIQITGSRAVTDVFVQTGHDFILQVNKDKVPENFDIFVWSSKVIVVLFTSNSLLLDNNYKGRVDILENYSVKLKNLQKTDSGLYLAVLTETIVSPSKILAEYNITVQVSPVELSVDSVSKSSDSCNLTVSCRTQDSDISSTFTCDTQTCSQEGGQRSKVTSTGASLQVSMVNDFIICYHSNQVSSTKYQETTKTQDLCIYSAAYNQGVLVFTNTGIIIALIVAVAAATASVFCLLKKRGWRRRRLNTRPIIPTNDDVAPAPAEHQNLSYINDSSLFILMESPTGSEAPTFAYVPLAAESQNPTQTEDVPPSCSVDISTGPEEPTETRAPQPKRTFAYVPTAADSQNDTDDVSPSCHLHEPTDTRATPLPKRPNVQGDTV